MVSVVSPIPTGGNSNFVQNWQKCQIYVIYENLECIGFLYDSKYIFSWIIIENLIQKPEKPLQMSAKEIFSP